MFQDLISILDGVNAIFLDLVFNGTAIFAIVLVPLAAGRIWTDGSLTPARYVLSCRLEPGGRAAIASCGMISQSGTCTVSALGSEVCQDARPLTSRRRRSVPSCCPVDPNEFAVETDGDSIRVDYDALNSITPLGASVDGGVTLEREEDGLYDVNADSRDRYPAIATYQYPPGEDPQQIDYDPGSFPSRPDVVADFAREPEDWPSSVQDDGSRGRYADGAYRLELGEEHLICGAAPAGAPTTLGFAIGVREPAFVHDDPGVAPDGEAVVGLAVHREDGPASARFDYFAASFAR
jgi:hypothetical protein